MKSLCLILVLLAICQCQVLVLDNWVSTSSGFSKVFQKPEYDWSNTQDLAVYGWFKIDASKALTNQGVLFHLTANADGDQTVNQKVGDYVLGVFYKNQVLTVGTYSYPQIPYYKADVKVRSQDVGKWTFFYVGYSGSQKKLFHRFEFNNVYQTWGSFTQVQHIPSSYYKLFVGYQNKYSKFPGQISKVNIQAGSGAYRDTNFNEIIPFNSYRFPNCPVVFDQCNYKGNYYVVCTTDAYVPDTFPIKSVYLPSGYTIDIHVEVGVYGIGDSMNCLAFDTHNQPRSIFVNKN